VFFISNAIRIEKITSESFVHVFATGAEILGKCLKSFDFFDDINFEDDQNHKLLNYQANCFLFDIIKALCVLKDI